MATSAEYSYVLRADGIRPDDLADLISILNKHFNDLVGIRCHPTVKNSYLIHHKDNDVAAYLLREKFLWTDNGNKVTFCLPNNDAVIDNETINRNLYDLNLRDDDEFNQGFKDSQNKNNTVGESFISRFSISREPIRHFPGTSKMNYLRPFEREIIHKIRLENRNGNPKLIINQKSSKNSPVLIGSPNNIMLTENWILKYLRTLEQGDLRLPIDMPDKTEQSLILDKVISSLREKFLNDPVVFEMKANYIVIHSPDFVHIESAKKYFEDNFNREFVPVQEHFKIEYMESHLQKELRQMAASKDFINIYAERTLKQPGYVIFGDIRDVNSIKIELNRLINSIEKTKITLNVHYLTEGMELMIAGIESKLNVKVTVSSEEKTRVEFPTSAIIGGVSVSLVAGKIEEQKVDVVVCSTGNKCQLEAGPIAKAISIKAGPELQIECNKKGGLNIGEIIEAKGYNLPCECVFLCLARMWDSANPNESQKVLSEIVSKCLERANGRHFTNIAFPPISCGVLGMPPQFSAKSIFDAIENYIVPNKHNFKEIIVAIYESYNVIYPAFQKYLESKLNGDDSSWKSSEKLKVAIVGASKEDILRASNHLQSNFLR